MRDRLIEVLGKTIAIKNEDTYDYIEWLADELLANGILAPPCKVGDIVYADTLGEIEGFTVLSIELAYTANGFEGDFVANNGKYPLLFKFGNIGKTVFLTREEAEAKLNERKEDESNG